MFYFTAYSTILAMHATIAAVSAFSLKPASQQGINAIGGNSIPHMDHDVSRRYRSTEASVNTFTTTALRGIDFDALADEDDECDFVVSNELSELSNVGIGGTGVITSTINPNCIELPTPNKDITPEEVVSYCMNTLKDNDTPRTNSGLEVCYNFSSDNCRAANGGSFESFIAYAGNPVFQYMVNCLAWSTESVGSEIVGTITRGAMKTVLVKVVPRDDKGLSLMDRTFLWTLMKERRPPRQNCWLVHECISVENAFAQTV
mmetsp:Transcript_27275/g.41798  ORF Transcript_27275/g.41798 Transcript_27275/m.41798 type:complete len:260 (-) Transcript_27275:22-801(-)